MQKVSPTVLAARMEHSTQIFVVRFRQKSSGAQVPELQPSYRCSLRAYPGTRSLSNGNGPQELLFGS